MKKFAVLFALLLALCVSFCAVAEEVDTYTSATLTKSYVEGEEDGGVVPLSKSRD
jgi:hypothetical protein